MMLVLLFKIRNPLLVGSNVFLKIKIILVTKCSLRPPRCYKVRLWGKLIFDVYLTKKESVCKSCKFFNILQKPCIVILSFFITPVGDFLPVIILWPLSFHIMMLQLLLQLQLIRDQVLFKFSRPQTSIRGGGRLVLVQIAPGGYPRKKMQHRHCSCHQCLWQTWYFLIIYCSSTFSFLPARTLLLSSWDFHT